MNKFVLLLCAIFLFSCKEIADGNDLYFENPQPINDSELKEIPNKFLGLYKDADSVFLKIEKKMITKYQFDKFRIHKVELDSMKNEYELKDGELIDKKTRIAFTIKKIGDSIELANKNLDTVFQFSSNKKAKSINGDLILNFKNDNYWQVNILSSEKKTLKFKYLSTDDLKFIDSIMSIKSIMIDSTNYLLKPSRKEFKKFLRSKLSTEILYKKI